MLDTAVRIHASPLHSVGEPSTLWVKLQVPTRAASFLQKCFDDVLTLRATTIHTKRLSGGKLRHKYVSQTWFRISQPKCQICAAGEKLQWMIPGTNPRSWLKGRPICSVCVNPALYSVSVCQHSDGLLKANSLLGWHSDTAAEKKIQIKLLMFTGNVYAQLCLWWCSGAGKQLLHLEKVRVGVTTTLLRPQDSSQFIVYFQPAAQSEALTLPEIWPKTICPKQSFVGDRRTCAKCWCQPV